MGAGRALVVRGSPVRPAARVQVVTEAGPPSWCGSPPRAGRSRGCTTDGLVQPHRSVERAGACIVRAATAARADGPAGPLEYPELATPDPTPASTSPPADPHTRVPYAELHCHSAFSFLDGASTPEHLVAEALRLGLDALAITDHDGLYGIVRFAEAAADTPLRTLYGAELSLGLPEPQLGVADPVGDHLLVLARGQEGYNRLSVQISRAQLDGGEKGRPIYDLDELADGRPGPVADPHRLPQGRRAARSRSRRPGCRPRRDPVSLMDRFGRRNVARRAHHPAAADRRRGQRRARRARRRAGATGRRHHRCALRRSASTARLAAAMAAVRGRRSLDEADPFLPPGPGAHLRSGAEMATLFARYPTAVPTAAAIGRGVLVRPASGRAEPAALRRPARSRRELPPPQLTMTRRRPPVRIAGEQPGRVRADREGAADHREPELSRLLPHRLRHRPFLPTSDILCQGRGSAANSAVCYALGITAVDAVRYQLLFERFLAPERDGPPDIDIDIESDRREEVIQYVYDSVRPRRTPRRWPTSTPSGRGWRCGTWPRRSATRPVSRTRTPSSWTAGRRWPRRSRTRSGTGGIQHPVPVDVLELAGQIQDYPRHLGIHSGGMVICDRPVAQVCPVEWGTDGEPLGAAVGQGRLRRHGSGEVRPARARHAVRPALRGRPGARARAASRSTSRRWISRSRRCTRCCSGPTRWGSSRSSRGRRWRPCRGSNHAPSTTSWWRSR